VVFCGLGVYFCRDVVMMTWVGVCFYSWAGVILVECSLCVGLFGVVVGHWFYILKVVSVVVFLAGCLWCAIALFNCCLWCAVGVACVWLWGYCFDSCWVW